MDVCGRYVERWHHNNIYGKYLLLIANVLLMFAIVILNVFEICALRKTGQKSAPNLIVTSLCISDLAIGVLNESAYILRTFKDSCVLEVLHGLFNCIFCNSSAISVYMLAVVRYVSLKRHMNGKKLSKRFTMCLIFGKWIFTVMLSILYLLVLSKLAYFVITFIAYICLTSIFVFFSWNLWRIVVESSREAGTTLDKKAKHTKRLMNTLAIMLSSQVFCVTPFMVVAVLRSSRNSDQKESSVILNTLYWWGLTLTYTNSAINSLIFCYRNVKIRKIMKEICW